MTSAGADQGLARPSNADTLLVPITLELSPIRRLLVIDVADDPIYRTVEPQVLCHPGGFGLLLLAYRHDGRVEVYAEPDLPVDPDGYDALGSGLAGIQHAPFDPARFEVANDGVKVDIAFAAPNGRRIELHLHEHLPGARDAFPALAPVGGAFDRPAFFPFVWLPGLSFVPARGTELELRVDGVERTVQRLPLPLGGRRCLMARYDPDVMVCQVNPDGDGTPPRVPARPTGGPSPEGVDVVDLDARLGIAGVQVARGGHTCAVRLDPPLPDLDALPPHARLQGAVLIQADHFTVVRARYTVTRADDRVDVGIDQFGPWRTRQRRPLLAVLFRLPVFRRWPTTYRWQASLDLSDRTSGGWRWTARWSRSTGT